MERLESYIAGEWVAGQGKTYALVNPATEEQLAETSTEGVDFGRAVQFARTEWGPASRGAHVRPARRAAPCHVARRPPEPGRPHRGGHQERRQHPERRQVRYRRRHRH